MLRIIANPELHLFCRIAEIHDSHLIFLFKETTNSRLKTRIRHSFTVRSKVKETYCNTHAHLYFSGWFL